MDAAGEPTIRELLERVRGQQETLLATVGGLRQVIDERDRRYTERDMANKAALQAALIAAEKASNKTDAALSEYKAGANEWRNTVTDLIGTMKGQKTGAADIVGYVVGLGGLIVAIIAVIALVVK